MGIADTTACTTGGQTTPAASVHSSVNAITSCRWALLTVLSTLWVDTQHQPQAYFRLPTHVQVTHERRRHFCLHCTRQGHVIVTLEGFYAFSPGDLREFVVQPLKECVCPIKAVWHVLGVIHIGLHITMWTKVSQGEGEQILTGDAG